jgi:hypothetical protein
VQVGDHDRKGGIGALERVDRRAAVLRHRHPEPLRCAVFGQQFADIRLVIDDQDLQLFPFGGALDG